MKTKLAIAALFVSVAMSCSVSEGQLLDRMLSRAGCSVCESAAPACSSGCDTGCGGGLLSGGGAMNSCGGGPGILDKIKERLANVGCGERCNAAPEPCGCAAPVVPSCGCDAGGPGLMDRLKGRLGSMGGNLGCAAPAGDCGCEPAPVMAAPVASCGCDAGPSCGGGAGLLDKLKGRLSSVGGGLAAASADCGCGPAPMPAPAPCAAPAAEPCGCGGAGLLANLKARMPSAGGGCGAAAVSDCGCAPAPAPVAVAAPCGAAAPACGGGNGGALLDRLKGRLSSMGGGGGCGCAAAPVVADCGCGAAPAPTPCMTPAIAPVSSCGCDAAPAPAFGGIGNGQFRGKISGLLPSRGGDCGCAVAAAPAPCGAASTCGGPRPKLSLLDRLRGNRVPRDRDGRLLGGGCNDGCNPPCPNMPAPAAPVSDCECGAVAQPVMSGCSSCDGGIMMAAPAAGAVYYGDASGEGVIMDAPASSEPAASAEGDEGGVIEKTLEEAVDGNETPAVDPNAFIIRKGDLNG